MIDEAPGEDVRPERYAKIIRMKGYKTISQCNNCNEVVGNHDHVC